MHYPMENLGQIIPYQAITGNNNWQIQQKQPEEIIPYQAITGNNNLNKVKVPDWVIIPYQAITGNNNGVASIF